MYVLISGVLSPKEEISVETERCTETERAINVEQKLLQERQTFEVFTMTRLVRSVNKYRFSWGLFSVSGAALASR